MSQEIEEGQVLLKSYKGFLSFCKQENSHNWVSVQNLLNILKQKNKFLSKDEFINLVSKKKLRMGDPSNFGFVEHINGRTSQWYQEHKESMLKTRSEYWDYVKKYLFGDPEGTIRGLMNINDLTNENLKEIVNLICLDLNEQEVYEDPFFLRVRGVEAIDKDDVFCPDNKEKLADDLIKYKELFNKQAVNSMVEKNDQNTNNSKKRLIAGIILVLLGIIGCSTTLGLGLAGQFAFVLLLFFITTSVTGLGCLLWKKIIECLSPCCLQIKNDIVDETPVDKNSTKNQEILTNDKNKYEFEHQ